MIRIPRWLVGVLGILFAGFHAGLGISNIPDSTDPSIAIIALAIYAATAVPTILFYRGPKLPIAQAIINFAAALLIPLLVNSFLHPADLSAYSTWYVMGVATLMAATAVRQQRAIAWIGTGILVIQVVTWAGFETGMQTGLPGALMLVFAGHAISVGLANAYREIMTFNQEALEIEKQQIANSVASEVRRSRLDSALKGALPILNLIREQRGVLSDEQKQQARFLEAELRDEIRGRSFMSEVVREAVRKARERGVEVIVLDEGGLDSASDVEKSEILQKAAAAIDSVSEGRITLRAPQGENWRATLVASRPGVTTPDLWLKF